MWREPTFGPILSLSFTPVQLKRTNPACTATSFLIPSPETKLLSLRRADKAEGQEMKGFPEPQKPDLLGFNLLPLKLNLLDSQASSLAVLLFLPVLFIIFLRADFPGLALDLHLFPIFEQLLIRLETVGLGSAATHASSGY
ncbi:hypothetical protein CB1_001402136 [Camelus ferus]|nr:hypothetical protein CB1_001402136 [Camelus ferus]